MDISHTQAQRSLIEKILASAPGDIGRVLGEHATLIDESFILLLRGQAASRAHRGDESASRVLLRVAETIERIRRGEAEPARVRGHQLQQMLETTSLAEENARHAIFTLLDSRASSLDDTLLAVFRAWGDHALANTAPEWKPRLAASLFRLGVYVQGYPRDRPGALEFAITAYHIALRVLTPDTHRILWGRIQGNLGLAYRERIRGSRAENVERARDACTAAIQIFSLEAAQRDWAGAKLNLALTLIYRIVPSRALLSG